VKGGALFVLLATAPALAALVIGLVAPLAHGSAIVLGAACALPLTVVAALLVAWPPASLRWAAIAAASAFAVRVGGGGMIAFTCMTQGLPDVGAVIATLVAVLAAGLAIEMGWWFRALRRAIALDTALPTATESAPAAAHHA
jgi:hypothetical protein